MIGVARGRVEPRKNRLAISKNRPDGLLASACAHGSFPSTGRCAPPGGTWPCARGEQLRGSAATTPRAAGPFFFFKRSFRSSSRGYSDHAGKGVLLAAPRGYCAGVERAVETVERALARYGPPVYVRKQIVHNSYVVEQLRSRGAVFVESVDEVPENALVVFSAHGVAPAVRNAAAARALRTIDATCPLVTKVHAEARRYAADGYTVVLVGHAGHEEVEGTMGEVPGSIVLVESPTDAEQLEVRDPTRIAYVTQTTLSVDETREIISVLRRRFPALHGPAKEDICYATTNRQRAVKKLLSQVELLLVIGSANSSNSQRLVEVAHAAGVPAHLIESERDLDERWLAGIETVGVSSGASAPEILVERLCEWFRTRSVREIRELSPEKEDVFFRLPAELRRSAA